MKETCLIYLSDIQQSLEDIQYGPELLKSSRFPGGDFPMTYNDLAYE